jgi:hypothetical protein
MTEMEDSGIQSGDFANLNPQDAVLFDKLVEVDFEIDDLKGVDDQMRERARRLLAMMGLLDDYPVESVSAEDRETLISATMLRIDREMDDQDDRMKLDPVARLPRLRLREFVAIAAVLIAGLAVALPLFSRASKLENTNISQASLGNFSKALEAFADDHDSKYPSKQVDLGEMGPGYKPWHLDPAQLFEYGIKPAHLDNPCRPNQPGNGYSFHSQMDSRIDRSSCQGRIIVSDGNLLLDKSARQPGIFVSPSVLYQGGKADKLDSCWVEEDHIWDWDRQRAAGRPMIEIFLVHGKSPQQADQGSSKAHSDEPAQPGH